MPMTEIGRIPTLEAKALPSRNGGRVKASGMQREGGKKFKSKVEKVWTSKTKIISQPQRRKGNILKLGDTRAGKPSTGSRKVLTSEGKWIPQLQW